MLPPVQDQNENTAPTEPSVGETPAPLDEKAIRLAFKGRAVRVAATGRGSAGVTGIVPLLYFVAIAAAAYVLVMLVLFTRPDIREDANISIPLLFRAFMGWFAPVLAAVLVLYYMIKPLFGRKADTGLDIEIVRDQQPLFFTFVDETARAVGATVPARILLNSSPQVRVRLSAGTSASSESPSLDLYVGLPLMEALDPPRLAAAIGAELLMFTEPGHAMANHRILKTYHWLLQSAEYRDSFDITIEEICESESKYIRPFGWFMRWTVRMVRGVLRGLVWLAALLGQGQIRRQRTAADAVAAQLCGGMEYTSLLSQLAALRVSAALADRNLKRCMSDSLPVNFAAFVSDTEKRLPLDLRRGLGSGPGKGKPAEVEPDLGARIRLLMGTSRHSLLALKCPGSELVPNYEMLAGDCTLLHYSSTYGPEFRQGWLLPNAEFLNRVGNKAFGTEMHDAVIDYHAGDTFHKLRTSLAGIGSCVAAVLILLQAGIKLAEAHEPLEMKLRRNIGLAVMVPGAGFRVIEDVKYVEKGDPVGFQLSYETDEEEHIPIPAEEAGLYYDTGEGNLVLCKRVKVHLGRDEIGLSEEQEEVAKFVEESYKE